MNRKNIFFTSDLHLHHENCIGYDDRPFTDTKQMRKVLIKRINSTVTPNSILYILGDIGTNQQVIREFFDAIICDVAVIVGNHDKGLNFYYGCGAVWAGYSTKLLINKEMVTLSHCPLRGILREDVTRMNGIEPGDCWHKEHKHSRMYSVNNEGQFHLHGHIHAPNHGKSTRILGRQLDVGVCANKYAPVSMSQVESWIAITLKREKENGVIQSSTSTR